MELTEMPDFRDAHPYPTRGEAPAVRGYMRTEEDDYWWAATALPRPDDNPTRPAIAVHRHQLCGHDCTWGSCSGLEGICISCEFRLQDDREIHRSRGMNRREE